MSEQQNERKETNLSEPKLRLYGKTLAGAEKAPVLIPEVFENNPRLRCRTNVPNDANKGYIDVAMTATVWAQISQMTIDMARGELKNETGEVINEIVVDNFGHPFTQQGRSKEKKLVNKLLISKDERGMISLTLSAGNNRPAPVFTLIGDEYHLFNDKNGNRLSMALASRYYTIGWFSTLTLAFQSALRNYVEPAWITKRKQQQGGQGGNGGQGNWNGNRGGYNNNQGGGNGGGNSGGGGQQSSGGGDGWGGVELDIPF